MAEEELPDVRIDGEGNVTKKVRVKRTTGELFFKPEGLKEFVGIGEVSETEITEVKREKLFPKD